MLYCVRYEDTIIWTNDADRSHRILVVNVKNLPYSICPLAYVGQGSSRKACEKLALIYSKPQETEPRIANASNAVDQPMSRKLSRSVSMHFERNLISQINMLAVVPVP